MGAIVYALLFFTGLFTAAPFLQGINKDPVPGSSTR